MEACLQREEGGCWMTEKMSEIRGPLASRQMNRLAARAAVEAASIFT
jgi:hypothetical protein